MSSTQLFEAALGLAAPWQVIGVDFDPEVKQLTLSVDFTEGTRFPHPDAPGLHPVYDTQVKRLRHLNFFQHECYLEVRVPRVKLPDGGVRLVTPPWMGQLHGFTLLFEALVVAFCQQMPLRAVARLVGLSWHRVAAIATRYVDRALDELDLSAV